MSKKMAYSIGTASPSWDGGSRGAQTITFVVTNDCNLRCKYCYITHKCSNKKMNFETAKKFIDYILNSELKLSDGVILEFIGGEPLLEVELIDKIYDYFLLTAYEKKHIWYWNHRISICTNGVNYSSEPVQKFIQKNHPKISLGISVDGTKEKHDMQRVFPDGSGSFEIINQNLDLWMRQFTPGTKVTFASDDLPLLKDSITYLWKRGLTEVNANVVFEDVWKENDDQVLEDQLRQLADYIIDNDLYNSGLICSFFSDNIGYPYKDEDINQTFCGAGKMIAVTPEGDIYPCIRYYGYSLNHHEEWPIGTVDSGIDMERVRPFMLATNRVQSDSECLNCPIASGCGFCQGFNYDEAPTPTNFYRAKYICKMHKARVRANEYYFAKLFNRFGIERENGREHQNRIHILLADNYNGYCCYHNPLKSGQTMDAATLSHALNFARQNFMDPILVHPSDRFEWEQTDFMDSFDITHIVPAQFYGKAKALGIRRCIPVLDLHSLNCDLPRLDYAILNISQQDLPMLASAVVSCLSKTKYLKVNITDLDRTFDENLYREELEKVSCYVFTEQQKGNILEVNLLTDILYLDRHDNCMAGDHNFAVSPSGDLYTCPAVYSTRPQEKIGSIAKGFDATFSSRLYKTENSNLCIYCDAYQCPDCIYLNHLATREYSVSPSYQCRKSHIERSVSEKLYQKLKAAGLGENIKNDKLEHSVNIDPVADYYTAVNMKIGYYTCQK